MQIFKDRRKNFGKLILMVTTEASHPIVVTIKRRLVLQGNLMGIIFTIYFVSEVRYYEPSASPVR